MATLDTKSFNVGAGLDIRACPCECLKCWVSVNHQSLIKPLVRLGSTIFVAKKLFKLQNKHSFLHSIRPMKIPKHKLAVSILQSFKF